MCSSDLADICVTKLLCIVGCRFYHHCMLPLMCLGVGLSLLFNFFFFNYYYMLGFATKNKKKLFCLQKDRRENHSEIRDLKENVVKLETE